MDDKPHAFADAPYRTVTLAEPSVSVSHQADGSLILRSNAPLGDYQRQVGVPLRHWAATAPDRVWLAERDGDGGWRTITYGQGRRTCDRISQALLDRGLGPDRPVMILSENSINFALLAMAAMQVGIPVSPVSPAYTLQSRDYSKLKPIFALLTPGMVYVEDGGRFEAGLRAIGPGPAELVVTRDPPAGIPATPFDDLMAVEAGPSVDRAFDAVTPDHTAKYLFTSGSTGTPKAVINTHRMLCVNQQMNVQIMGFLAEHPPTAVDWLPWHHTAAGNMMFNLILFHGGTYYLDAGRPVPGLFEETLRNLKDVAPTVYFNVPAGFGALIPHLERDRAFREHFFRDLEFTWYAGAALTQDLWDRYEQVAYQATGQRVVMTSGFGTTESAPSLTFAHWAGSRLGNIGVPLPGIAIKLAPVGDKMEIRAKGPSMSPGYYKDPEQTVASRDEDGFFKFGDAVKLIDPALPETGLLFDGRLSENFKLASGTWVGVGPLRSDVIAAAAPVFQDLVVCGHDRNYLALLAWPSVAGCQSVTGRETETDMARLIDDPQVRAHVVERLSAFNRDAGGSSRRIKRVILMAEPAQIDAGEITDKGYINQRAAREHRADLVQALYDDPPSDRVIEIP